MLMSREELDGYVNYRCRGPSFPLACNDTRLDGSEENPQTMFNKVEVQSKQRGRGILSVCVCVYVYTCVCVCVCVCACIQC